MNEKDEQKKKRIKSLNSMEEKVALQLQKISNASHETKVRFLKTIPKVELHVHLEGTFEPEMVHLFRSRNKLENTKTIKQMKDSYEQFTNLQSFLDIYYENCSCLLTQKDFYDLTFAFLKKAALEENIVHVEIFFDPQSHLSRGISLETIMNGLIQAKQDAIKEFKITAEFICCFLRHLSEEDAFNVLSLVIPYKEHIVGFGLDSAEQNNPPEKFKNVVQELQKLKFRFTAHAGEEGSAINVLHSLTILKSERIDHGVKVLENNDVITKCVEQNVGFTICPKSNVRKKTDRVYIFIFAKNKRKRYD